MSYQSVTIPLDHLDPQVGAFRRFYRNYTSEKLSQTLHKIAGKGRPGLWWSEWEAVVDIQNHLRINWAWCPVGEFSHSVDATQSNKWSHMRIFFRDPQHAMLFKLTWL